jgi:hypothetical protein
MTVAAVEALALETMVAGVARPSLAAARFQRGLAKLVSVPWAMATTEECRYRETQGAPRGMKARLGLWYVDRVLARGTSDATVMRTFVEVTHLTKPTPALVRPRVLFPVLLGSWL